MRRRHQRWWWSANYPPIQAALYAVRNRTRRFAAPLALDFSSTLLARGSRLRASIASTEEQLAAAAALVESRYAGGAYAFDASSRAPPGVTLIALEAAATVGTMTLRLDGPTGLAADEGYRATIDAVRERGRSVCASSPGLLSTLRPNGDRRSAR